MNSSELLGVVERSLLVSVPKRILERGYAYFRKGAVISCTESQGNVYAAVQGSRRRPYIVQIKLGKGNTIQHAWCNCPYNESNLYGDHCKHICAALLKYLSHKGVEQINASNPILKGKEEFKPATVVTLIKGTGNYGQLGMSVFETIKRGLSPVYRAVKEGGKRYRLVFVVEKNSDDYYNSRSGLNIIPMLQYLKKNGEPGRIERFGGQKITEDISQEEHKLLSELVELDVHSCYDGCVYRIRSVRLHTCLDDLIERRLPNLFVSLKGGYYPVVFEQVGGIELSFQVSDYVHQQYLFKPVVRLIGENNSTTVSSISDVDCCGATVTAIGEQGKIFYKTGDAFYGTALKGIFSQREGWTYSDIAGFKDACSSENIDRLKISFDSNKIKRVSPVPKVLLTLSDQVHWVEATLSFNYLGREFSGSGRTPFVAAESEGETTVIVRNRDYETRILNYLRSLDYFDSANQHYFRARGDGNQFFSQSSLHEFLCKHGARLIDDGIELKILGREGKVSGKGTVSFSVNYKIDWFDVNAEYTDDSGKKSSVNIDADLLTHGFLSVGKNIVLINKDNRALLEKLIKSGMGPDGTLRFSKYNFEMVGQMRDVTCDDATKESLEAFRRIGEQLKSFRKIERNKIPLDFKGCLRDYQIAGFNWLHFLHKHGLSGCLADDMGLGKTVQALAFLQSLKEQKKLGPSLIVVPVNVLANWENEIKTFTPNIKYAVHAGLNRARDLSCYDSFDLIIVSYHTLRSDIELFSKKQFGCLVLDESQNIKNFNSQIFKAVKSVNAGFRFSLTGTPVENNTMELWAQMDFLIPHLLGSQRDFKRDYAYPIESAKDADAAERLKKTVFPFILRRKKELVAKELPEKSEVLLYADMESAQEKIYKKYAELYRERILRKVDADGLEKLAIEIFAALMKLRQIALFPKLADKKYSNVGSGKFELLKDTIDEIISEKHKILVFSQFLESLQIINGFVNERGYGSVLIDGSVSANERKKRIEKFQNENDAKVFLLSLKAGGVGVNLTAADYVILFDPWWNPAVEEQAIDRAHRIGQKNKVIAYKMITKGTVEEKILELQNRKKDLVKNLIATESSFYKSLTREDIAGLFN